MSKVITKYVCERTGKEFKTKVEAEKSEIRADAIKSHFAFWKNHPRTDILTPRYEMGKATEAKIISVKPDPQEAKRWTNEISG